MCGQWCVCVCVCVCVYICMNASCVFQHIMYMYMRPIGYNVRYKIHHCCYTTAAQLTDLQTGL